MLAACGSTSAEPDATPISAADADPSAPDANPNIAAELGTGTIDFEPLTPEQDLELISGEQGGHHVFVHARMKGLLRGDPSMPGLLGNPVTRFAAFREDGTQLDEMAPPYRLGYAEESGEWSKLPSGRLLIMQEGYVPTLVGSRILIRLWITDASGGTATDERWVHIVDEGTLQN